MTWALVVAGGLLASYPIDPYIFGLTCLVLACSTAVVVVLGLILVVFSPRSQGRARVVTTAAILLAVAAVAAALRVLGGFNWA